METSIWQIHPTLEFFSEMQRLGPFIMIALAVLVALMALFGDNSYYRLLTLQEGLEEQERRNHVAARELGELKAEVAKLQYDDRTLEKAARKELGMARPNELIYLFEDIEEDSPAELQMGEEREGQINGSEETP